MIPQLGGTESQVVKAMALIQRQRDGALLVAEAAGPSGALLHRPLGGHVECGEYALEAMPRSYANEQQTISGS